MPNIQVQLRRGTDTQHSSFTGAVGEVTVDTTNDTLRVHDGSTAGGVRIARHDELGGIADGSVTPAKTSFLGTVDETADGNTKILSKQSDGDYDSVTPSGDVTMTQAGAFNLATNAVTADNISSTDNTFKVSSTEVVINEGGTDVDFRVEGDTNANLIVADAGVDKVGIRGAIDSTFPVYIHGDQAAGMGVTGNIQINRLAGAGIRYFTDNASDPNKTTDITTTTTGNIEFAKPDKTSNKTTHLFEANGDIETLTGSYGTLSDRNLKENINYLNDEQKAGQVEDIKNLKFAKYNLKGEGVTQLGVIAQDVEQTSPGLVSKSIIDGSEVRSVKQSIIHQKAVVALQVALQKIEDLEARIQVLESK